MGFLKPKWRRKLRKRQKQVETLGVTAEGLAERHFFRRLERLTDVRRFVIAWLLFFVLVSGCLAVQIRGLENQFQSLQPVPGGLYTEGIVGDFTNANPLFATSEVDDSVSKLLFAGLLTHDEHNRLVGDLAESWSADATGKVYTVRLKPNLYWHDGEALTAKDVLFTYQMIQNPDALSSLNQSWKDIAVAVVDPLTVTFTLPNVLSSFPHNMMNGLIPEHILKDVPPSELRSSNFNTLSPVGSGPFAWQKLEISGETPETREEQIALRPFDKYHFGRPKLAGFDIHAFHDPSRMEASFKRHELTAASFSELPSGMSNDKKVVTNNFILTAANMVFFRQGSPVMSDAVVRRALAQGVNVPGIISALDYPTRPVRSSLLQGQLAYDSSLLQPEFNPLVAAASLDGANWKVGPDGIRTKAGQRLRFSLWASDTPESRMVTAKLKQAWRTVGADADIRLLSSDELQRSVVNHEYDALLYGISIGADPDIFAYWHSSQNDPRSNRLNFSEYNSKVADQALEAGRTRIDANLRTVKYHSFLQAWQQDVPALGLYQPRYMYVTQGTVYGLGHHAINQDTDRYNTVSNWQIREASVTNSLR